MAARSGGRRTQGTASQVAKRLVNSHDSAGKRANTERVEAGGTPEVTRGAVTHNLVTQMAEHMPGGTAHPVASVRVRREVHSDIAEGREADRDASMTATAAANGVMAACGRQVNHTRV
jgi:hypothetical protein